MEEQSKPPSSTPETSPTGTVAEPEPAPALAGEVSLAPSTSSEPEAEPGAANDVAHEANDSSVVEQIVPDIPSRPVPTGPTQPAPTPAQPAPEVPAQPGPEIPTIEPVPGQPTRPAMEDGGAEYEAEDQADGSPRETSEFAALLAESEKEGGRKAVSVGERVRGRIVTIGAEEAFVDFGGRAEGVLPLSQIRDAKGELRYKEGDTIEAAVASLEGQVLLNLAVRRSDATLQRLIQAKDANTPVEGKVKGTNSGGFEVALGGVRGFCPFSQMDLGPVGDGQAFVGQVLSFKVIDVSERGRRVVLSRKALLTAERSRQASELRERLAPDLELEGSVIRLQPFGAFVDIGGIHGLVHVSEIAHRRVNDPSEVLAIGQKVRVRVLRAENLGQGKKERVSLSIKATESNPWENLSERVREGDVIRGSVMRITDFGVFVEILPGVDGLIHVSQLARRRIAHPRDIVSAGQEVEAKVMKVDPAARRISLSMSELEPMVAVEEEPAYGSRPPRRGKPRHESGRKQGRRESRGEPPPSDSVFAEAFRRARERKGS